MHYKKSPLLPIDLIQENSCRVPHALFAFVSRHLDFDHFRYGVHEFFRFGLAPHTSRLATDSAAGPKRPALGPVRLCLPGSFRVAGVTPRTSVSFTDFVQDLLNYITTSCVAKMTVLECMYIRQAIDLMQGNCRRLLVDACTV